MKPVILLWTGGWDSTFRLLQLLRDTDARIQPLYLVDDVGRESTPKEIKAIREIRSELLAWLPEARDRLLPTDYGSFRATEVEPHYRRAWERLNEQGVVGRQYPVMASYAEQNGIERMESGILGTDEFLSGLLRSSTVTSNTPGGHVRVLSPQADGPITLFERFAFPLLGNTKLEMKEEAERREWMHIMGHTWFCDQPTFGLPCGDCFSCQSAQKEGVEDLVGRVGPVLNSVQSIWKYVRHPRMLGGLILRRTGLRG